MQVNGKLKESLNQLDNCYERISKTISVVFMSYLGCTCLFRYMKYIYWIDSNGKVCMDFLKLNSNKLTAILRIKPQSMDTRRLNL